MSLNLAKDTRFGLESKYEIKAETLSVNGVCTQYGDECLVSCKNIPNTQTLTYRVTETDGSNQFASWVWSLTTGSYTCDVTMNPLYTAGVGYACFQSIDIRAGDVSLVRPVGIVKKTQQTFTVAFLNQTTGFLDRNAFTLMLVGTFP